MKFVMHADGGCWPNPGQSFCGVVIRDERGVLIENVRRNLGMGTNNTAEWNALITALEKALEHKAESLSIFMDSRLVVMGINGRWRVKDAKLRPLRDKAVALLASLYALNCPVSVQWVPREQNADADALTEQRA